MRSTIGFLSDSCASCMDCDCGVGIFEDARTVWFFALNATAGTNRQCKRIIEGVAQYFC